MHAIGNVSLTSHRVSPRVSFSPSDRSNFPRLIRARRFNGSRVLTSVTGFGTTGSSHAGKRNTLSRVCRFDEDTKKSSVRNSFSYILRRS